MRPCGNGRSPSPLVEAYRDQDLGLFSARENFRAGVSVHRTKAIT
jgi:hypothetical protein